MKRNILALLLVLCLVMSALPVYAINTSTSVDKEFVIYSMEEYVQTEEYQEYREATGTALQDGYMICSEQAIIQAPDNHLEIVPIEKAAKAPIVAVFSFIGKPVSWKNNIITIDMEMTCTAKILWEGRAELAVYGSTGTGKVYGEGSGKFRAGEGYFTKNMYDSTGIYVGASCPNTVKIKPTKLYATINDGSTVSFRGVSFSVNKDDFK